jgi:hypothetical protein
MPITATTAAHKKHCRSRSRALLQTTYYIGPGGQDESSSAQAKLAYGATLGTATHALPLMSFNDSMMLQVRLTVMPACGQLACMDNPLGVPGELSGPLLVKRCLEV